MLTLIALDVSRIVVSRPLSLLSSRLRRIEQRTALVILGLLLVTWKLTRYITRKKQGPNIIKYYKTNFYLKVMPMKHKCVMIEILKIDNHWSLHIEFIFKSKFSPMKLSPFSAVGFLAYPRVSNDRISRSKWNWLMCAGSTKPVSVFFAAFWRSVLNGFEGPAWNRFYWAPFPKFSNGSSTFGGY